MLRFEIVLFSLMICFHPVISSVNVTQFREEALLQHNIKRQAHCVPPLVLNETLNNISQNYAIYLATNNLFRHSGAPGLGENLWAFYSSAQITNVNGSTPTNAWYNEISLYNYNSPGFSSGTGHFTQVIWRASTRLGIGVAFSSNGRSVVVVANYAPQGNVIGSFPANVPPLCLNSTTTTPTPTNGTTTIRTTTTPSPSVLARFQQEALNEHNAHRRLHCVPALVLNSTLNIIAQNYSNYLARNRIFNHSGYPGLGENLWSMSSSVVLGYISGSSPTISWYNEISSYNYSSPGFSPGTGHFTQVVWQSTTQLGVGISYTNDSRGAYVVANYGPPGNVIGSFASNVRPLCSQPTAAAPNSSAVIHFPRSVHMIATIYGIGLWMNSFF